MPGLESVDTPFPESQASQMVSTRGGLVSAESKTNGLLDCVEHSFIQQLERGILRQVKLIVAINTINCLI